MERLLSYRAGTASIRITPEEPLWLAGYAARTAPARGKISDLYASALALEDPTGYRFVMASADVIAITRAVADSVADSVFSGQSISREQLLLAATHTHYGPEFRLDKQRFFNIPFQYAAMMAEFQNRLIAALIQAVEQALAHLVPVRLFIRQTWVGFAHNRRRHGIVCGTPLAEDVVDHDVPVLDCVDNFGNHIAIVFGYACHNTTIEPEDLRYCGDWAGFAKQELQQAHPGATALFIPGAGADQNPEPRGSVELSRQHGHEIATAVAETLNAPGIEISGPIRAEFEEVCLPLEPVKQDQLKRMLDSADPPQRVKAQFLRERLASSEELITSYPVPIQAVSLGNELLVIALGGEPVADWAYKFKRPAWSREPGPQTGSPSDKQRAPGRPITWVAGYCNDMFGYLPTRRIQQEGGYEGGRAYLWSSIPTPFTDDVEDRVTETVCRLVTKLGAWD
jgi:hypothetical protein